jgi:hypothetical protein
MAKNTSKADSSSAKSAVSVALSTTKKLTASKGTTVVVVQPGRKSIASKAAADSALSQLSTLSKQIQEGRDRQNNIKVLQEKTSKNIKETRRLLQEI